MPKIEHYKKRNARENINKLLNLLKQYGKLNSSSLEEKLGVSSPTLSSYLKELEENGDIEHFFKPKDRRERWYRIKFESREKVEAQLQKYEAIKFIEGMSNPLYTFEQDKSGNKAIAAFISRIDPKSDKLGEKIASQIAKQCVGFLKTPLLNRKMAVVIMVKGES